MGVLRVGQLGLRRLFRKERSKINAQKDVDFNESRAYFSEITLEGFVLVNDTALGRVPPG